MGAMKKDTSSSAATTHNPQAPLAAIVLAAIVLLAVIWVGWDLWNRHGASRNCDDGPRYAIDTRQFATEYTAYSLKLEGSLNDKAKGTLTLDPVQQEKLSEALESANEFRKYLVAGYNACAITKAQYAQFGARFHVLDSVAYQIDTLSAKPSRTEAENASLATLIAQYSDLAHKLGTD
jgi:hypothetical protein